MYARVLIRKINTKKFRVNLSKNFLFFKTRFEEINTKPVLKNKIISNIDYRQPSVSIFRKD